MSLLSNIRFILQHPLNRHRPLKALLRMARWQLRSRVAANQKILPFVNDTRFYAAKGWTGVTGNIYCGLHEYADMAFVLHFLRADDLFIDAGANMGSYTILASGVCAARTIAIEPVPLTYERLCRNVALNDIAARVKTVACGLGAAEGVLQFSTGKDTMNRVTYSGNEDTAAVLPVTTLDILLAGTDKAAARLLKIDVEGYETAVLQGAKASLQDRQLKAVIIELNGSGAAYGFDERAIHQHLLDLDFIACTYEPRSRSLAAQVHPGGQNVLYVRDPAFVEARLKTAPAFTVLGQQL